VLDGRFNFGGIKNPIYDHLYNPNNGQGKPKQINFDQSKQNPNFSIINGNYGQAGNSNQPMQAIHMMQN